MHAKYSQQGATIIETLVVFAIISFFLSLVTVNVMHINRSTVTTTSVTSIVSDIKQQQTKAMVGDSEGVGTADNYGIYFSTTSYTLFRGASYNSSDVSNFVVKLETNLQFSPILFPSSQLIFTKGSGEVLGYNSSANSVGIKDITTNGVKTIQINRYGVITSVN